MLGSLLAGTSLLFVTVFADDFISLLIGFSLAGKIFVTLYGSHQWNQMTMI